MVDSYYLCVSWWGDGVMELSHVTGKSVVFCSMKQGFQVKKHEGFFSLFLLHATNQAIHSNPL
jgi:hypothetical protein